MGQPQTTHAELQAMLKVLNARFDESEQRITQHMQEIQELFNSHCLRRYRRYSNSHYLTETSEVS
jgi:hypothetical protein